MRAAFFKIYSDANNLIRTVSYCTDLGPGSLQKTKAMLLIILSPLIFLTAAAIIIGYALWLEIKAKRNPLAG